MNYAGKFDANFSVEGPGLNPNPLAHVDSVTTHAPSGAIIVPDADLLFNGEFKRSGVDLVISRGDHGLVLHDYFKGEKRAPLASPDGAHLNGDLVNTLTGHVEYSQAAGGAAAAEIIGHVTKLVGSAAAIRNGVSIVLNQGDNVEKGDVITTGEDSTVGITFIDGTVFGLSHNARMVLNEMVYDPNGSNNTSLLSLVSGTISFVAGETAKHGDMKVDTPVATMGIRGTAVLVEIDFTVQGTGDAPPAKFQVLAEPDGSTGSFILFDKNTLAPIATVNQAGTQTIIDGHGNVSFLTTGPLSADAQRLITDVFSLKFTDLFNANPKVTTAQTDSIVPVSFGIKLANGDTVSVVITPAVNTLSASSDQSPTGPGSTSGHVPIAPAVTLTTATAFTELANTTGDVNYLTGQPVTAPDSVSGLVAFTDINQGERPTVSIAFKTFTYQDAHQNSIAINPQQLADIQAVEQTLVPVPDPANANNGFDTWTYSLADKNFDFLAAGEVLTLTYAASVNNNYDNHLVTTKTFTITITGTNDAPVITSSEPIIPFAAGTATSGGDLTTAAPTSGTFTFTDPDLTDTHTVSVSLLVDSATIDGQPANLSVIAPLPLGIFENALTVSLNQDSTVTSTYAGGTGTINWQLAPLHVYLADFIPKGQTLTLTYAVTVTDSQNATSTQDVVVTITGTGAPAVVWIDAVKDGTTLPSSGDWNTASNWETGTVPLATQDAIIITDQLQGYTPVYPVTINAPAVANSVTMADFESTPPSLVNSSTLTIGKDFDLFTDAKVTNAAGATITVGGKLEVEGASSLQNSGLIKLDGGDFQDISTITNYSSGTIEVTSGGTLNVLVNIANAGAVTVDSGAYLTLSGATISGGTVTDNGAIDLNGGAVLNSGTLANSGTITVSGTGNALDKETITANHALEVTSGGALTIDLGSTVANTSMTVDSGGTLTLSAATITGGTVTDNGAIDLNGGAVLNSGTLANSGTITVSGTGNALDKETITANHALEVTNGGALTIDLGSTVANTSMTVDSGGTLTLSGATITGGTVTDNGAIDLNGGAVLNSGTLANSGTITVSGTGNALDKETITANHALEVTNGGALTIDLGSTVANTSMTVDSGGTLTLNSATITGGTVTDNGAIDLNGGAVLNSGTLANSGTITVSGTGNALDKETITANHALEVTNGGALTIDLGSTVANTSMTVDSGGTLTLNSATITGGTVTDNGAIDLNGGAVLNSGTLANSGTITVSGTGNALDKETITANAALEVTSGATLTIDQGSTVTNTSITVDSGGTLILNSATITGGTITDSVGGTIHISGSGGEIDAATVSGGGQINVDASTTLTLHGTIISGGTLTNSGTVDTETSSASTFDGVTVNNSGGTIQVDGGVAPPSNPTPIPLILDDGTTISGGTISVGSTGGVLEIETTSGATLSALTVNNAGTVQVNGGSKLTLTSATISGGTVTDSGTIDLNGTAVLSGGSLGNSGAINVSGTGNALHAETLTANAALEVTSGGALTIDQGSTITNTSMTVDSGGTLTLNSATISGGTVTDNGTLNLNGGAVLNSGTLANSGAINVSGTGNSLDKETVTANAALTVTSGATLTIDQGSTISNTSMTVGAGATLTLNSATIDNGTVTNRAGGNLDFNGGAVLSGGTLVNNGTITVSGTNNSLDAETVSASNILTLTSGAALTIDQGSTVTNTSMTVGAGGATLTLTSATINGGTVTNRAGGNLDLNGTAVLSGGTLVNNGTVTVSGTNNSLDAETVSANNALTLTSGAALTIDQGSTVANTSTTVGASATLTLNSATINGGTVTDRTGGNLDLNGTAVLSGGSLVNNGTVTVSGTNNSLDAETVSANNALTLTSGAALTIDQGSTVANTSTTVGAGATLTLTSATINGGTVTNRAGGNLDLYGTAVLSGGTLVNNGTITVSGTNNSLDAETVSASNILTLTSGATLTIDQGSTVANTSMTVGAGGATLTLTSATINGGTVTNRAGGNLDLYGTAVLSGGTLVNNGAITISGTGNSLDNETVSANNALTLTSGATLTIDQGSTVANTSMTVGAGGATLTLNSATINGGAVVDRVGGFIDLNGTAVLSGGSLVNSGTITVSGTGNALDKETITANHALEVTNGGALTIDLVSTVANTSMTVDSGGTLTLNSATITGGTVTDNGAIDLNGGAVLNSGTLANSGTITVSGTGNALDKETITANAAIEVTSGATLTIDQGSTVTNTSITVDSGGTLILNSATISGGTITDSVGGTIHISGSGGEIDAATVSGGGQINVDASTTLTLHGTIISGGTLTNSGTVDTETSSASTFDGVTVNNSGGTIQVDGGVAPPSNPTPIPLILDDGTTISGGTISVGSTGGVLEIETTSGATLSTLTVNNAGTVQVNGGSKLTLTSATISGGTVTDSGTIEVSGPTSGSTSKIIGGATLSGGTVTVDSSQTLQLNGTVHGTTFNDPGTIQVGSGGSLTLAGTDQISGGQLSIGYKTTQSTVSGITFNGVSVGNLVANSMTLMATMTISASSGSFTFTPSGNVTVTNNGSMLVLSGTISAINSALAAGFTYDPVGNMNTLTISVADMVGDSAFRTVTINGAGTNAVVSISNSSGAIRNAGLIDVTGTTTLSSDEVFTGSATLQVESGAKLDLVHVGTHGGTINDYGTIEISGGGRTGLNGGSGGGVHIATSGFLIVDSGTNLALNQETVTGGTITDNGTIEITANSAIQGTTTSAGTINTVLNSGGITVDNGVTLTLDNVAVTGTSFTNSGTVKVDLNDALDLSGASITSGTLTNSGTIDATGTDNFTSLNVINGGSIEVTGSGSVLNWTNVTISGGTVSTGDLTDTNGGLIEVGSGTSILDGSTNAVSVAGYIQVKTGATLEMIGTIDNTGVIDIDGQVLPPPSYGSLVIDGTVTLDGGGTVTLDGSSDRIVGMPVSGGTLNNYNTISGAGTIGDINSLTLHNETGGVIEAINGTLTIHTGAATFVNDGTLEAGSGGTLVVDDAITGGSGSAMIAGGTLEIGIGALDSQAVTFSGSGTLKLDDLTSFTGAVSGFAVGDTIDLANLASTSVNSVSWNGTTLEVNGTPTGFQPALSSVPAGDTFGFKSDGASGTELVVLQQVETAGSTSDASGVEGSPITLHFTDALTGVGNSATLTSFVIDGIPADAKVYDGNGNLLSVTNNTVTLDQSALANGGLTGLNITTQHDTSLALSAVATATDVNGYEYTIPVTESVTVTPAPPVLGGLTADTVNQGGPVTLGASDAAAFTDDTLGNVTITGLGHDFTNFGAGTYTASTGTWTGTAAQFNTLTFNAGAAGTYDFSISATTTGAAAPTTGSYTLTVDGPTASNVAITNAAAPASPGWSYDPENGHYYRYVATTVDFSSAESGAANDGVYLATVTNGAENVFVANLLANDATAWTGGESTQDTGTATANAATFYWLNGPEAGMQFTYSSWNNDALPPGGGEPTGFHVPDGNIEGLQVGSNGEWNDVPESWQDAGYVEEYGGLIGQIAFSENTSTDVAISVLLASDTDTYTAGNALTVSAVGTAAHGKVTLKGDIITYHPDLDYSGADSFSYTITDGTYSSTGTVTFNVAAVATLEWSGSTGAWDSSGWTALNNGVTTTDTAPTSADDATIDETGAGPYTVTIDNTESANTLAVDSANATVVDSGSLTLTGGLEIDAGIFNLQGGSLQALSIDVTSGATFAGYGTVTGPVAVNGAVEASGGTLDFQGFVTGTATFTIAAGATLEFDSVTSTGPTVSFASAASGTLLLGQATSFQGKISGFSGSDVLDLRKFTDSSNDNAVSTQSSADTFGTSAVYNSTSKTTLLTVTDQTISDSTFVTLAGDYSSTTWSVASDGSGGVNVTATAPTGTGFDVDVLGSWSSFGSTLFFGLSAPTNDTLTVSSATFDNTAATFVSADNALEVTGTYGTFKINKQTGDYQFVVDPTATAIHDLAPGATISDTLTYTVTDSATGLTSAPITATYVFSDSDIFTGPVTVNGMSDNSWTNASNWMFGEPTSGEAAYIGPNTTVDLASTVTGVALTLDNGAELSMDGATFAGGSLLGSLGGTVDITGTALSTFDASTSSIFLQAGVTIESDAALDLVGGGGPIQNAGSITVDANATLEIGRSLLLTGGGVIGLSDETSSIITSDSANTALLTLVNQEIVGTGHLGDGNLAIVVEAPSEIAANLSSELYIDTGSGFLTNHGLIVSNGSGGLDIAGDISSDGTLQADEGLFEVHGAVTGSGFANISAGTMQFDAASDAAVTFTDPNGIPAVGTLVLGDVTHFTGTVTGFSYGDTIDLQGIDPANVKLVDGGGGVIHVAYASNGSFDIVGGYSAAGFTIGPDSSNGTDIVWNHQAPTIGTDQFILSPNGAMTTIEGLYVSDSNASASTDTFTMTATTEGAPESTITPSSDSGSLTTINNDLDTGITYDPGTPQPDTDKISLTVTDNFGSSATENFIFNQAGTGPNITLTGTTGNDVIFGTGYGDTLTGGGGQDQFVFAPSSTAVQHTITDFSTTLDKIDLRLFTSVASLNDLVEHQQGSDTLITIDSHDTLLLKNVVATNLTLNDFLFNPNHA